MTNNKSTFLYIRITEKDVASGDGELQGRALAQWCTQNQIKNFQIFADRGATKLTDERAAFDRMMAKMKLGECANLVVLSLDRIARSKSELSQTLESVRSHNVRFISLQDQMDTKTTLSILTFLHALMKMEKAVIGERLQAGRKKSSVLPEQAGISL